jgi:23S rRNA (uridine2552-2'-O)-methyltransferase
MGENKHAKGKKTSGSPAKKQSGDPRADHYFYRAKSEGFAARSVYKLEEIDKKYRLLRPGMDVLDLGCHPGSWTQYASKAVQPGGRVLGIDRTPTNAPAPNAAMLAGDIFDLLKRPHELFPEGFHVVLSDMAPNTSGIRDVDHARSLDLAEAARSVAVRNLKSGGSLLIKIFQGPDLKTWMEKLKENFDPPLIVRPEATRSESREIFVLCRRFRSSEDREEPPAAPGDN